MAKKNFEVVVIGGGVAGLATAHALARSGETSVVVLEQEKKLGGHASGRNAGMLRLSLPDPALVNLARETRRIFAELSKGRAWKKISLKPSGSLLLASGASVRDLSDIQQALRAEGVPCRRLSAQDAVKKVPLLDKGRFHDALFCPSDAVVDTHALLRAFLRDLKQKGIHLKKGCHILSIRKKEDGFLIGTSKGEFACRKVVNAAGAWASLIAAKAGAFDAPLRAYRRHLFLTKKFKGLDPDWPFVWDLNHDFYFRPFRRGLLVSPCDKSFEAVADRREKVDRSMKQVLKRKLKRFSEALSSLNFRRPQSGLRTMTPDGRFVVGEDPLCPGFFWVAGLGGHGVTTCFAVGRLAAALILGRDRNEDLAEAFSPNRFVKLMNREPADKRKFTVNVA